MIAAPPQAGRTAPPGSDDASSLQSLAPRLASAGRHVSARQIAGLGIGFATLTLLTRWIGAEAYGIYATGLSTAVLSAFLCQLGIGPYLIRSRNEPTEQDYRAAWSALLFLGLVAAALQLALSECTARWTGVRAVGEAGAVLAAALVFVPSTQAPLARLERALRYRDVARIELTAQLAFAGVALPLAMRGWSWGAPCAGWIAQQACQWLSYHIVARHRPVPGWRRVGGLMREATAFGAPFTLSSLVWQARGLVAPLVLGPRWGMGAVGAVALALRLADAVAFAKGVFARIGPAALARIGPESREGRSFIARGTGLQALAVGACLAALSILFPLFSSRMFGAGWSACGEALPAIAAANLLGALVILQTAALSVRGDVWTLVVFHAVNVAMLTGAAYALVPRWGVSGYGAAELVSCLSFIIPWLRLRRAIGAIDLAVPAIWAAGFTLLCFTNASIWFTITGASAILASLAMPRRVHPYVDDLRRILGLRPHP